MDEFSKLEQWDGEKLHQIVLDAVEVLALKLGKVAQPLRVAISGSGVSPAIDVTLALLGREKTLARMSRAIEFIKEKIKCRQGRERLYNCRTQLRGHSSIGRAQHWQC